MSVTSDSLLQQLEQDGIAIIPGLVGGERLTEMQRAFESRLERPRFNNVDGYEKIGRFRHMVEDVLTLAQGFVDAPLDSRIKDALDSYLGTSYELVEAKGWLSLPTDKNFHGWHGDKWYDQDQVGEIQREVKLAVYLSDVQTGAFHYVKGTHGKEHPHPYSDAEVHEKFADEVVIATGAAGTGILFDTTGIHRQGMPILEPRNAVFYCYHDPAIPLQPADMRANRYHPLILNAAFLGGIDDRDKRILGFGNDTNFNLGFVGRSRQPALMNFVARALDAGIAMNETREIWGARIRRVSGR